MADTQAAPHSVFISYRRSDTAYPAGWLYDSLSERFGSDRVFKDVDSVDPGEDFIEKVTIAVTGCDVLLALIGKSWVTTTDTDGVRRLERPDDLVRLEIETALNLGIRVIPVLVDGAQMPTADDVPSSLGRLVRRHAVELAPHRFNSDLEVILRAIVTPRGQRRPPPPPHRSGDHWPPPPPPQPEPPGRPGRPRRTRTGGGVPAALVGAMTCAAVGAVLLLLGSGEPLMEDGDDLFVGPTALDLQRGLLPLLPVASLFLVRRPSAAAGWLVGTGWAVVTLNYAATTIYAAVRVGYEDEAFGTTSLTLRSLGAAFVLVATFVAPAAIDRPPPAFAAPIALALVGASALVVLGSAGMRHEAVGDMPEWLDVVTAAGPATLLVVALGCIVAGLGSATAAAPVVTGAGVAGVGVYALELLTRNELGVGKTGDVTLALLGFVAILAVGAWQWAAPTSPPRRVRSRTAY